MFTDLLAHLSAVYKGDVIYLPDQLKPFIEPWLKQESGGFTHKPGGGFQKGGASPYKDGHRWNNKIIMFFSESEMVKAFKKMPLPHVPEKVVEEPFVIEFTLETVKPVQESSKNWEVGAKKVKQPKQEGGEKLW